MDVEQAVHTQLRASAALVAALGSIDRIYPSEAEDDIQPPYVVYGRVGTEKLKALDGTTEATDHTVLVNAYALTFRQLRTMMDAIDTAVDGATFNGWRGFHGDSSADEVDDGYESVQLFDVRQAS